MQGSPSKAVMYQSETTALLGAAALFLLYYKVGQAILTALYRYTIVFRPPYWGTPAILQILPRFSSHSHSSYERAIPAPEAPLLALKLPTITSHQSSSLEHEGTVVIPLLGSRQDFKEFGPENRGVSLSTYVIDILPVKTIGAGHTREYTSRAIDRDRKSEQIASHAPAPAPAARLRCTA